MLTDTHCHLTNEELQDDIEGVVKRANDRGVTRIITAGTDFKTSQKAIELSEKFPSILTTIGLHPEEAMDMTMAEIDTEVDRISQLIQARKVLAIGEIGMDRDWIQHMAQEKNADDFEVFQNNSFEKQKYALNQHLELALQTELPVIIHCRGAEEDLFEILSRFTQNGGRGVLHSFTGDESFLEHFVQLGWFVSFNGIITFENGENVRGLCREVPVGQILLETDAPFLAPEPHRGKPCEPQYIVEISRKLAEIKGVAIEELESILEENVGKLFGKVLY